MQDLRARINMNLHSVSEPREENKKRPPEWLRRLPRNKDGGILSFVDKNEPAGVSCLVKMEHRQNPSLSGWWCNWKHRRIPCGCRLEPGSVYFTNMSAGGKRFRNRAICRAGTRYNPVLHCYVSCRSLSPSPAS